MAQYILFDDKYRQNFLPLTHTRSIADLRCGILTIKEKWNIYLQTELQILTQDFLQPLYPIDRTFHDNICINTRALPRPELISEIQNLAAGEVLISADEEIIAFRSRTLPESVEINTNEWTKKYLQCEISILKNYWELFKFNDREIKSDFNSITKNKTSEPIPPHVQTVNPENIFIEKGAQVDICILNARNGCIYIGKDAHIMDGAMIRGSAAICDHAVIKMGAKIYEHTTIGPHCKVGGEVSNVIFHSYSNKGHDGYLGNALIGSWCNLGADTNCSNLKNDYGPVQVWSESENKRVNTGEQFVGLMMGDHSKCAINTMFNTGTIVGVCCNVFGSGFPPVFIPSFSWGWSEKMITYRFEKALDANNRMMERRHIRLSPEEVEILKNVYNFTEYQRK